MHRKYNVDGHYSSMDIEHNAGDSPYLSPVKKSGGISSTMLIAPRSNDKLRSAWVWKSTPVAQLEPLRRTGKTSYDWLRSRPAMPHWRIAEKNVFGLKLPCSLLPDSGENLDRGLAVALSWKYDVFDGELPLLERTTNETLSSLAPMAKPWFF